MSTTVQLVLVALVGLAVASFSGVIIARLPLELDEPNEFNELWDTRPWSEVLGGRSRCDSCGAEVRPWHNVPIVSWLALRGRCSSCGERIPATLLVVELLIPALAVWVVAVKGLTWSTTPLLVLVAVGTIIAAIDLRILIVPTRLVWPATGLVVAASVATALTVGEPRWLAAAGMCVLALAGPLFALWWLIPQGMGFGDVRLAVFLGWITGFSLGVAGGGVGAGAYGALLVITGGALVGILIGIVSAVSGFRKLKYVPFGPSLVIAAFFVSLAASPIIDAIT